MSDSESVKSLTSNVEKLLVGDSSTKQKSKLMFPSITGTWTNTLGYQVSSHIFLLPSGTEKNQLELIVKGRKGSIKYLYPKKFLTTKVVKASQRLPESHSKVTTFQRIFNSIFKKLPRNESTASDHHDFTFPFEVNPRPIHFEINYYKKRIDRNNRQHVLYVLELDFESKERIELPNEVKGGDYYGSASDNEEDSYVAPPDEEADMDDDDNDDDAFYSPSK